MKADWTSIHSPSGLRDWATLCLELGLGLFLVALLAVGGFTFSGVPGAGLLAGLLLAGFGFVISLIGALGRRVAPVNAAAEAVQRSRQPWPLFGERAQRADGTPLSKEEDDIFRNIVGNLGDDPREGSRR